MTLTRTAIKAFAKTFSKDEDGATAIEYGLFAALVGAVIVGTVATLGTQTNAGFDKMSQALSEADKDSGGTGTETESGGD
jgi:pilus assembly protein Flp/PilA